MQKNTKYTNKVNNNKIDTNCLVVGFKQFVTIEGNDVKKNYSKKCTL